jgi:hypothetical protein
VDGGGWRDFGTRLGTQDDNGCAFILDDGRACGADRRTGSAYCAEHHALCHVVEGSPGERRRLRETEALALAVGGRQGRPARSPPDRFLRRLENVARVFSRPKCSRIVRSDER